MIVLFWSEWKGCGITSNMEAVAAQIAMQHHKKCVLVQTKRINNDISASFLSRKRSIPSGSMRLLFCRGIGLSDDAKGDENRAGAAVLKGSTATSAILFTAWRTGAV